MVIVIDIDIIIVIVIVNEIVIMLVFKIMWSLDPCHGWSYHITFCAVSTHMFPPVDSHSEDHECAEKCSQDPHR